MTGERKHLTPTHKPIYTTMTTIRDAVKREEMSLLELENLIDSEIYDSLQSHVHGFKIERENCTAPEGWQEVVHRLSQDWDLALHCDLDETESGFIFEFYWSSTGRWLGRFII